MNTKMATDEAFFDRAWKFTFVSFEVASYEFFLFAEFVRVFFTLLFSKFCSFFFLSFDFGCNHILYFLVEFVGFLLLFFLFLF